MNHFCYYRSIFLCINYLSAQNDSVFFNIEVVKIQIWNTGVNANCASEFKLETVISNDTVYVFEIDKTGALERCTFNFDLCTEITGLLSGTYQVVIYRQGEMVFKALASKQGK